MTLKLSGGDQPAPLDCPLWNMNESSMNFDLLPNKSGKSEKVAIQIFQPVTLSYLFFFTHLEV